MIGCSGGRLACITSSTFVFNPTFPPQWGEGGLGFQRQGDWPAGGQKPDILARARPLLRASRPGRKMKIH